MSKKKSPPTPFPWAADVEALRAFDREVNRFLSFSYGWEDKTEGPRTLMAWIGTDGMKQLNNYLRDKNVKMWVK